VSAAFKTKSEQKLDWLESLHRPLSDRESEELRRAMHAVYCRNKRLAQHEREERALLAKMQAEACQAERYPYETRG
jgi:hypothetical protein